MNFRYTLSELKNNLTSVLTVGKTAVFIVSTFLDVASSQSDTSNLQSYLIVFEESEVWTVLTSF